MTVSRERQTQIHEPLTQASVMLLCFVWDLLCRTLETLSKLKWYNGQKWSDHDAFWRVSIKRLLG